MRARIPLLAVLIAFLAAPALRPLQAAEVPPLVEADWLAERLGEPGLVVLDIRNALAKEGKADYLKAHIPGSVHSDYLKDGWRTKVDGVGGQLPPVESLEALIGGLGIGNDDHVVVVAGGHHALDMGSATRVFFTFKVLGHDAVSILDGGFKAWAEDPARPLESGEVTPEPEIFSAALRPELLASREEVAAASQAGGAGLVDFRPTDFYEGRTKHDLAQRPGTIPGARSLPENKLTENNGGRLVDAETARSLLRAAGVEPEGETIAFCNTGHWASLGWFVEHELLGNKKAKVYDGSMADWTADPSRPVQVK